MASILLRALALLLALAAPAGHDLSVDEAMGGHTLARHVGKTDAELIERLRREPQISSASTYTDRATAERVVGAALAEHGSPEAALRAYRADAAPVEIRRFRKEAKRFLALSSTLDFDTVRALLHELGSRWIPRSREALIAVLTDTATGRRRHG